jgi:methylase of polypeptide subunit release factors
MAREPRFEAESLTEIFGWSRLFRSDRFSEVTELLQSAGELETSGDFVRSTVRFSTLGEQLYVHSAFPTDAEDAVFFGPDTYRFARVIKHFVLNGKNCPTRVIDLGCGTGAGGIYAASLVSGGRPELVLVDINEKALRYSSVNCALNGAQQTTTLIQSDLFDAVEGMADLIISNPPYLVDPTARAYRHGGARGFDLSLRISDESLSHLKPGGRMILYTGTPVVRGADQFLAALSRSFAARSQPFLYEEVDPDVFGEELDNPSYGHVDRIAAVSVVADLQ